MASAAAAQAAVATAQAAMEVACLAAPSVLAGEHCAAIVVQTAFRRYLVYISYPKSISSYNVDLLCI